MLTPHPLLQCRLVLRKIHPVPLSKMLALADLSEEQLHRSKNVHGLRERLLLVYVIIGNEQTGAKLTMTC